MPLNYLSNLIQWSMKMVKRVQIEWKKRDLQVKYGSAKNGHINQNSEKKRAHPQTAYSNCFTPNAFFFSSLTYSHRTIFWLWDSMAFFSAANIWRMGLFWAVRCVRIMYVIQRRKYWLQNIFFARNSRYLCELWICLKLEEKKKKERKWKQPTTNKKKYRYHETRKQHLKVC